LPCNIPNHLNPLVTHPLPQVVLTVSNVEGRTNDGQHCA
jgi:hypothetical protein